MDIGNGDLCPVSAVILRVEGVEADAVPGVRPS